MNEQKILELAARSMFDLFSNLSQGMMLVDRAGLSSVPVADDEERSFADIEVELMRVVSQALSDRVDIERTTRSLLAELKRLAGLDQPRPLDAS